MSKTMIPNMPKHVNWTDDQWKAIWAKDQDILVAAAAGSGKTAVLVNRVIQKVLSEEEPIDVDELLVVTFTNASAAEMRHRISEALETAISEHPRSQHLRRQLGLLNRASISTLHSFCLDVIRTYYYLIDIDPGFRIANSTEAELLRDEVMEDLFEEYYGREDDDAFFRLVDAFTNDRSDGDLQKMVRSLHDFSRAHPNPNQWLDEAIAMYDLPEQVTIDELPFVQSLRFDIELQLAGAKDWLEKALALTKVSGGPAPRAENFLADLEMVAKLSDASERSWQALYEEMQTVTFTRAKSCSGDEYLKELVDEATKYRDYAKKMINSLQEELFARKPASYLDEMRELKGYIETLVMLVKQFNERFAVAKAEKNLVDFADLEHYCLAILTGETVEDERVPSEAALTYRKQFKEVLVDEYQDVNLVQESILQLVTADGEDTGNLFMVGDVKQSVYRFRLAEPNLFLGKYRRFTHEGKGSGLRIDLNQNFRSRREVLDGTNFIFQQVMGLTVGEIDYDEDAQLKQGAPYPEQSFPIDFHLINMASKDGGRAEATELEAEFETEEVEKAQVEARMIAKLIKQAIADKQPIYDPKTKQYRSVQYRDIVILLRSMPWAPQMLEECKKQGIPVYANVSTGYFEATEVAIMLALLKVIDNPQQDIPLASVLRSPIVGLDEEELAQIRGFHTGSYYEALAQFYRQSDREEHPDTYEKVASFYRKLIHWRKLATESALSDVIWLLYRETRFYDFVGGMPGGKQRQANLRALYDRARQYEASSFRGLFRFLRFIEQMQERGDDLGVARALGEQEDVVRLMTIHSSKGLEFPLVFIAGLSKPFNMMDVRKSYLLDKEYGFATKYVNPELRITYPSLPQLAFKKKKQIELMAEEMRVLYVALTRAKEKVYIIASVKDVEKSIKEWASKANHSDWLLQDHVRASAKSYLDWVGPALIRHRDFQDLQNDQWIHCSNEEITAHCSNWSISIVQSEELMSNEEDVVVEETLFAHVKNAEKVELTSEYAEAIQQQLDWKYPQTDAALHRAKQSVSELKRQFEVTDANSVTELIGTFSRPISKRPTFMQEKSITPAEKGTITHLVMQHLDVQAAITVETIQQLMTELIQRELLTVEQQEVVNPQIIVDFFQTDIGQRLQLASVVQREVPFMMSFPAKEAYPDWQDGEEEVLVQGVIDCLFEDDQGLVLLDYKTDAITNRFQHGFEGAKPILADRYRTQLQLYTRAVEGILKKKVTNRYLFFFDGAHVLEM